MEFKRCEKCGKIIEGFSVKDLKYRMLMHSMKHRKEEKKNDSEDSTQEL